MDKLKKQEAEQAVPVNTPTYIDNAVRDIRESQEEAKEDVIERELKILAQGSESDFWRVLKDRIESRIKRMRKSFSQRLGEGRIELSDVGIRSLIINEVADALSEIVTMVEYAKRKQISQTTKNKQNIESANTPADYDDGLLPEVE